MYTCRPHDRDVVVESEFGVEPKAQPSDLSLMMKDILAEFDWYGCELGFLREIHQVCLLFIKDSSVMIAPIQ